MLNEIIGYFDLQSERRSATPRRAAGKTDAKHAPVLPQYGAVALGVLADPLLNIEKQTLNFDFAGLPGRTAFALLIAIVLLPALYKNAFDPDKPLLVQLCALFTSGVGWQSLFQAAVGAGQQAAG